MNTINKGNNFEKLCLDLLYNTEFISNELGLQKDQIKIYSKNDKSYKSIITQSEIKFDISIEYWAPNSDKYSILIIIECKDAGKIPVDDIKYFKTQCDEVGAHKSIIISKNGFQMKEGYLFAQARNVSLLTLNEELTYSIILHKTNNYKNKSTLNEKDKILSHIQKTIIKKLLEHVKAENKHIETKTKIPFYKKNDIETIVNNLIYSFDKDLNNTNKKYYINDLIEFICNSLNIEIITKKIIEEDNSGRKIVSYCDFINKYIAVDIELHKTNSYNFILAHELGHYLLHNKIVLGQNEYESFKDTELSFYNKKDIKFENERQWIEWQANVFAANLVMPKNIFEYEFSKIICQEFGNVRLLYVDDQKCNITFYHKVLNSLSTKFSTSKTSVLYRLRELKLIKENYTIKNGSEVFDDFIEQLKNKMSNKNLNYD